MSQAFQMLREQIGASRRRLGCLSTVMARCSCSLMYPQLPQALRKCLLGGWINCVWPEFSGDSWACVNKRDGLSETLRFSLFLILLPNSLWLFPWLSPWLTLTWNGSWAFVVSYLFLSAPPSPLAPVTHAILSGPLVTAAGLWERCHPAECSGVTWLGSKRPSCPLPGLQPLSAMVSGAASYCCRAPCSRHHNGGAGGLIASLPRVWPWSHPPPPWLPAETTSSFFGRQRKTRSTLLQRDSQGCWPLLLQKRLGCKPWGRPRTRAPGGQELLGQRQGLGEKNCWCGRERRKKARMDKGKQTFKRL